MSRASAVLARLRVPLGFGVGAAALWLAQPTMATVVAGGIIACAGEALRVWAAGHLIKSREVTSSGPYRLVAHPLYVGSSIMGAGVAIGSNSSVVSGLVAAYLAVTITAAIRNEEEFLRRRFGERYERYQRSGASVDGGAIDDSTAARRFSIRRAVENHEPRALVGLAAAILLLLLKATYNGSLGGAVGP